MISYIQLLEINYEELPKQLLSPMLQKLHQQIKTSEKLLRKSSQTYLAEEFDFERWSRIEDAYQDSVETEHQLRAKLDVALERFRNEQRAITERREEKEARRRYEQLKARFDSVTVPLK